MANKNNRLDGRTVRPWVPRDVPAIHRVLAESPEAAYWSMQAIEDVLRQTWVSAFISEGGGELTGFIVGRRVMDEGEILNLAVRGQSRRHGDGQALVGELLNGFQRGRVRRVFLEVRESNSRAIRFYGELGFLRVGRREGYYRDPTEAALVLQKKLEMHNVSTE